MRKLFSLFAAVLFAGSMMAAGAKVTLDFTDAGWGFPTDYVTAATNYTNGGYTITVGAHSDKGHKAIVDGETVKALLFGKKDATIMLPAMSFDVSKIVVKGVAGSSGKVTFNIFVGEDAVSTEATSSLVDHDFVIADGKQAAGTVYVIKVTNANNCQISAIEFYEAVAGAPEKPTFSVAAGTYGSAQSVELACATEGAEIFYTTDGTDPTAESFQYTTAIPVIETTTIKAVAIKDAVSSDIASATYTIVALDGAGTKEDPFSVADVVKLANSKSDAKYWVMGYIVGCAGNGGVIGDDAATNIALGDAADQQEGLVPVQLPTGAVRDALNIVDNPSNKGKQVKVHGDLQSYFQAAGVKNVDEFELIDDDPKPMAQVSVIEFTAEAAKGTLNDSIFFSEDSLLKLAVTDTDNKIAIDANKAKFGDAKAQEEFAYRLKSGGKSSDKNNLKLTAAVDGKLLIAARTSTADDTTRTVVLVQEGDTLYNELVLEKDTLPGKIYPFIMVDVKAGDIAVTYPVGAINFYTFALVVEETPIESDTIEVNMSEGLRFSDNVADEGWWQIYGENEQYAISISNVATAQAEGTYTIADLDADYTYLGIINGTDTAYVSFTAGSVDLSIDAETGDVTVAGTLVGNDENIYKLNLVFVVPIAKDTVTVNIADGKLYDGYASAGLYAVYGSDENDVYVQLAIWADEFQGDFTEADLDNQYIGSYLAEGTEGIEIYAAVITVTPGNGGDYRITAAIQCYNDKLYNVTMYIPAAEGIEEIMAENEGKTIKFVQNGQIYILKTNKVYGIRGERVR